MTENKKKILEMLAEGKISVDEASRLLSLVDQENAPEESSPTAPTSKKQPKYLRVVVHPNNGDASGEGERVNVRVPLALLHAGVRLATLIPAKASDHVSDALKDKGIDLDMRNIKPEHIDQLIEALSDLEVDVHDKKEKVRVYVE